MKKNTPEIDTVYPASQHFSLIFSAYEDRLILNAVRSPEYGVLHLLLTRRMVMLLLQQLLAQLPALSGLTKTPGEYWQEVLTLSHQRAMQTKSMQSKASADLAGPSDQKPDADTAVAAPSSDPPQLYLATELTVGRQGQELTLAFKALPMPKAMTVASAHVPVMASVLQPDHVHQLIQLLINKSQEAQWHLPVNLPWLENPSPQPTSIPASGMTH